MIEAVSEWLIWVMCMFGCCSVICRLHFMDCNTSSDVAWRHILLGSGFAGVPVIMYVSRVNFGHDGTPYALAELLLSITAYLVLGAHRWRHADPSGIPNGSSTSRRDQAPDVPELGSNPWALEKHSR